MQRLYVLFLFLTIGSISSAQKLSVSDLEFLLNKNNTEEINRYFSGKNWEYEGIEDGDSEYEKIVTWSYDKDNLSKTAIAWVSLYSYTGIPELIIYSIIDDDLFNAIQAGVNYSNYEKYDKDNEAGIIIEHYKNPQFYLHLSKANNELDSIEEGESRYISILKKRGGFYDPQSGAKKVYYEDGTLKESYHLVNGQFNGLRELYSENGKLEISVNYENDVEHGEFTHYFYDDEGENEGELVLKETGEYNHGQKDGIWKVIYLGENEYRTLEFHTYTNGVNNGAFQEAQGDSLVLGTYKL